MENNNKIIQDIESLYPADSSYTDTAEIGNKLLFEAISLNWRLMPIKILEDYRKLCLIEQNN